ncbi:hypothetical protein AMK59_4343 [Oryctes borbonicus]|uniref:Phospholipase A2 n=1 Tax=Oryctes borbonicus TaxID=1629725 RepID=A0A0T6B3S9_9SCAR|nr:hypothetical protein AMK59_4343 [Oryctes borbonicus]
MNALILVVLVWVAERSAGNVISRLDARLTENEIYYGQNDIFSDIDNIDWSNVDTARIMVIFPGTNWCGTGNISANNDDLGIFEETDKCCREHDFCDDVIAAQETKYNLTNTAFYSRLNCRCDEKFKSCLKEVGSIVSGKVGEIYFNLLNTQCFRKDYPATCTSSTILQRCTEYEYDTSQEQIYQWFYVPYYNS